MIKIGTSIDTTTIPLSQKQTLYDNYNYDEFWLTREYEHQSEVFALHKFFKAIKNEKQAIADIGGGSGRLVPYYAHLYQKTFIVDPSIFQIEKAKSKLVGGFNNIEFKIGTAQQTGLSSSSLDAVLIIRVSHHVKNTQAIIAEAWRILRPGGFLIFEVANKLHCKARLRSMVDPHKRIVFHNQKPVKVNSKNKNVVFLNHDPRYIINQLGMNGFHVKASRSVSNFRSPLLKSVIPLRILMIFEKLTQKLLSKIFFGPSIIILACKPQSD